MKPAIHAFASSDYRSAYLFRELGGKCEVVKAGSRMELAAKLLTEGLSESKKKETLYLPFPLPQKLSETEETNK